MKKNLRKRLVAVLGATAMAFAFTATGCADTTAREAITPTPTQEEATPTPTEEPTPEPTESPSAEPSYVSFGTESADSLSAVFENGMEQNIKGIEIRSSEEKDFGENLMKEGEEILPGEMFRLYANPADLPDASASAESSTAADAEEIDGLDVAFNETFDVKLTLADDTQPVLYDLGFDDIDTGVITYSATDEVAYITYVSTKTAQEVSTLDAQIARVMDEAAALAEEEAQAEATAARKTSAGAQSTKKPSGGTTANEAAAGGNGGGAAADEGGNQDNSPAGGNENEGTGGGGGGNENEGTGGGGNDADEGPGQVVDTCIDEDDIEWND